MPPVRMRGDGRKAKNPGKTLLRIFGFMKRYIPNLILVLLCIVITAVASTRGSENLGTLVDDYILPMVAAGSADFGPLIRYLVKIAAIFGCGMVVAAGTHDELMQTSPIYQEVYYSQQKGGDE